MKEEKRLVSVYLTKQEITFLKKKSKTNARSVAGEVRFLVIEKMLAEEKAAS